MTKFLTRICAVLITVLLLAALAVDDLPVLTVSAADTPVFSLEANVTSAKTGDIVTVSLYVDNPTDSTLSSFDGDITFNSSHFKYVDFSCPEVIGKKLTCRDSEAATSSKIAIIFSDTTKTIIPAETSHLLLLQLRFSVISPVSGSGQIICSINNSYSGSTSFGEISPATLQIAVEYAAPTSSTTSSSATTTTSTTTKQRSSDAKLRSLSVAPGTLSPAFNPEFVAYSVSVEFEIATIRISATPNSASAVASGIGIKDLAVGQNTFTVTVTAEDGTTMQYGIVVIRAAETQATSSTTSTTTTSSTTPYIDPTGISTITGYPEPTTTTPLPTASQPDKIIDGGNDTPSDTELVKIIGIIFAEVALFMFGFLAGFFLDKNMKKKTMAEIAYGPLDRQPQRRDYYPPAQDYNQPEYSDYPPEYPDYQPEYQDYSDGYQQESYPQYSGYDSGQRFDEYGNPILDNAQYDDGFWEYGDNRNDPYYH